MYIYANIPFEKQTKLRMEDISRESSWLNCIKYFLHVSLTFFCNEERQKQSEPTIWLQPVAPIQFFSDGFRSVSKYQPKSKVGQKANCQTMPTMKIGLEVISSWVCCSAPNGDLRVQISIDFYQSFANFVQIANFGDGDSMSFCIMLNVSIDVNFAKLSLSIGRCKSKDMNSHNEAMV